MLLRDAATALPHIVSFAFLRVSQNTPLQGADMIATESFWHAKDVLKYGDNAPPRPHFQAYLKENFHKTNGEILDRQALIKSKTRLLNGPPFWDWAGG